ncbi:MAG: GNAT family N-acetyltransferase [Sporolactobacillus sp.]
MIIKRYNRLEDSMIEQIRSLESRCVSVDGTKEPLYLDDSLHFNPEINHTFLAFEKGQPISILHLFMPTAEEAELSARTLPEFRGQGYFSALLICAEEELIRYHLPDLLFVVNTSLQARYQDMLSYLGAQYDFSEYMMILKRRSWNDQSRDNGIEVVQAETVDPEALVSIRVTAFGDSPEDARSRIEKSLKAPTRESYVAKLGERNIGVGSIDYEESVPCICGFAVQPRFQGMGYGRRFLALLIQDLFAKGYSQIKLEVDSKNSHALHLYQKIGFVETSGYAYYRKKI